MQQSDPYRFALENSTIVVEIDSRFVIVSINELFCRLSGFFPGDLTGKSCDDLRNASRNDNLWNIVKHGMMTGITFRGEVTCNKKNGELLWLDINTFPVEEDGTTARYLVVGTDATARVKAQKVREQFLSNMSHDIRTPLFGIVGLVNLLGETSLNFEQQEYTRLIRNSTEVLTRLVADLLDVHKMECGVMALEQDDFSLHEVFEAVAGLFVMQSKEKFVTIGFDVDPQIPPLLLGDAFRLKQMVMNLVANAFRHTEYGRIQLTATLLVAKSDDCEIKISVADNGSGIPAEEQVDLFRKFTLPSRSDERIKDGVGLGFSIVNQLVAMHGGHISVDDSGGIGTRVSINIVYKTGSARSILHNIDEAQAPGTMGRARILVVDDLELNRFILSKQLEKLDVSVDYARDGAEAVNKVASGCYELVIMDMHMPVMDGFEASTAIRELSEPKCRIPILAVTASIIEEELSKCILAGANDYLIKPYKTATLFSMVARYLHGNDGVNSGANTVTDFAYLDDYADGNADFKIEMLQKAIDYVPEVARGIDQSVASGDWTTLRQVVHKLVPVLPFAGLSSLVADAQALEKMALELSQVDDPSRHTATKELATKVTKVALAALPELRQEYQKLTKGLS